MEKITSKIMQDAKDQIAGIEKSTKEQCDAKRDEAAKKADQIVKDAEKKGAGDKVRVVERRRAVADIDGRNAVLKKKQEIIDRCFDAAVEKISGLDKHDYIEFLVNTVKTTGSTRGEVILNERDARDIGYDVVKELNRSIPSGDFKLSEETRDIRAGLFVRDGKVYYDGSIESIIRDSRSSLASEAADILFRQGE
ncbi:MAG: V-type ATP synthase subunit E [Anaerovoracaceae bacterium]